ncbi:MAG: sigma 54-interacting transcriptional regulator [Planctomycetia bacterium]|nr:sigma 54-interacting transcriptional regulator [Planctomycetia bacterium]
MSSRYEPKDHIQRLEIAPRAEGVLDQREITIQSYQTTVPFDYHAIDSGLGGAWLTPQTRFGVFSRNRTNDRDALNVVLGLQDELTIRAYDYDERRPLWFSWQNAIVDTANIHYFRDEDGLLRFTTTGGGRRITDDRLHDFNSAFLGIPEDAVSKRHFDLEKLRDLCFSRFADRLYMVRFSDPSGKEYRSIDHALFQSRKYIDPNAERLKEISTDTKVKIESFDSDITVHPDDLASSIQVRFFIRGLSGSLRLRFPKITYKNQLKTPEEQAIVFYRLADATVSAILDAEYYTHQRRSLEELSTDLGMFPDMVDLTPFREVLTGAEARRTFMAGIDVGEPWQKWSPHLQALDELLLSDVVMGHVKEILGEFVRRDPRMSLRLLAACQTDPRKLRVGALVAGALAGTLPAIPAEVRAQVEETLLSWAIDREQDSWDVNPDTGEFSALNLTWRVEDVSFDVLPVVIWKLVGVLHARLTECTGEAGVLLRKLNWCMIAAAGLPAHHSKNPAALRLLAAGKVPKSVVESDRVLRTPIADLRALDDAMLDHYGLPLWPLLTAIRRDGKVRVSNDGVGAALAVGVQLAEASPVSDGKPRAFDLMPGQSISLPLPDSHTSIDLSFEKLGRTYRVVLPVADEALSTVSLDNLQTLPLVISRKRLAAQRKYRETIDPQEIVVGSSRALLDVFEQIHYANLMDGLPPVLLLGEPGVGKTHIAKLLHDSSSRSSRVFKVVNAGGGGGDINIQRGEWIGYGRGHGIQGIDKNGRAGHLMDANGGTLFIDEFATLSHDLQVIFLYVLERRSIEKIGGESFTPDVRCILATNADVEEAVTSGTLRRDLLDRIPIRLCIPPLRERRGDILLLAKHFATGRGLTDRCLVALLRYRWPGNVRELQNTMAAAMARQKSEDAASIDLAHVELPADIVSAVEALNDETCRRDLWIVADEVARDEGFEHRTGLQRRAGEIMGVGESQASKTYRAFGLAGAASA